MTRPFDKHLDQDELDLLVSPDLAGATDSVLLPEQTLGDVRCHVETCQDCNMKVQMHRLAQKEIAALEASNNALLENDCVADGEWLDLAAGVLPEIKTRDLLKHAARCRHCGLLLRRAAETLSDEATPREEELLNAMDGARPVLWRRDLVRTLQRDNQDFQPRNIRNLGWRSFLVWPRLAFAIATLLVVVGAVWIGSRPVLPSSAEQLLAQAYTENRTLEVRIPGATFAPMRVVRGAAGSNLDKPQSLLRAEALISESLSKYPNDLGWVQAKARADLLDGNYESAIRALQEGLEANPDSASLMSDLAAAYFERAESVSLPLDYGNAIQLLGVVLAKSPDDPVALFNRALISERLFLYTQAVTDWQHYLRVDPKGEWADDARRRLEALTDKLKQHQQSLIEPLRGPSQFAAMIILSHQDTLSRMDARIEEYLDLAIREWLPLAYTATGIAPQHDAAKQALVLLGELLSVRHKDRWLVDLMNSGTSEMYDGAEALARSVVANASGDPSAGLTASLESERFFRRAGSQPGLLRARVEELYSLHRLFHSSACLKLASAIKRTLNAKHYSWMEAQVRLEEFSCLDSQAKMDSGSRSLNEALNIAEYARYPGLLLRTIGFDAVLDTDKGDLADAIVWDVAGLSKYWSTLIPPQRAYQFYDDLTDQAQRSGKWHLAIVAGRDAIQAIAATPNLSGEAMAHFQLAISLEMVHDRAGTAEQYAIAQNLFSGLQPNLGIRGFEADSELQLADVEASQGRTYEAESRLRKAKANLPTDLDSFGTWVTYYSVESLIAGQRGDEERRQRACYAVVAIGELGLSTIRTERDRLTWSQTTGRCYRELVSLRLKKGDPTSALSIWEWYQASAVRSVATFPKGATFAGFDHQLPALNFGEIQQQLPRLDHETVLTYEEIDDGVSAWIYDNRGVHWKHITVEPKTLAHISHEFASECANPKSDVDALRQNGRLLYGWLVAPFEAQFDPKRTLIVEADGVLASVPFQALVQSDGSYLGMRRAMVSSPGLGYMLRLHPAGHVDSSMSALVVGEPAASSSAQEAPLPDASREAEQISQLFKNSVLLVGRQATQTSILQYLVRAKLFHFAGHSLSGPEGTGLVVAPDFGSNKIAGRTLLSPDIIAAANLNDLDLVVLSACSTGRTGDEGLAYSENNAEAFLRAGVPHVIASQWNVDSTATATLMNLTYQALKKGKSVPDALQAAYLEIGSIPATAHPFYWAAFAAFGDA